MIGSKAVTQGAHLVRACEHDLPAKEGAGDNGVAITLILAVINGPNVLSIPKRMCFGSIIKVKLD